MKPGLNLLPDEELLGLVCRAGVVTHESIDPLWGGENEQYDTPLPVEGYIQYCIVRKHPAPEYEGEQPYLEMRTIFVDKTKRRAGVGTLLFRALEDIARQNGIQRITVKVNCSTGEDANPFCKFLPKMGYTVQRGNPLDFDWQKYV